MDDIPKSSKEAKILGSKIYFTGQPCKYGHHAPRNTKGYWCVECERRKRHADLKMESARTARYRIEKKDEYNSRRRQKRKENPEHFKNQAKKSYVRNKDKAIARALTRRTLLTSAKLYEQHKRDIYEIYANKAPETVIDHIIPVNGAWEVGGEKVVCGLHVPWNLQEITWEENSAKKNKIPSSEHWLAPMEMLEKYKK